MIPFNIHADTLTDANIIGFNFEVGGSTLLNTRDITIQSGTLTQYNRQINYNCNVLFDDDYIGYVTLQLKYYWYESATNNTVYNSSSTAVKTIYLDGSSASFSFGLTSWYNADPLVTQSGLTISPVLTITSSNVVSKKSVYERTRQWNIDMESFGAVSYLLLEGYEPVEFVEYNYIKYPVFKINNGETILQFVSNPNNSYNQCIYSFIVSRGFSTSSLRNSLVLDDGEMTGNHTYQYFYADGKAWTGVNVDFGNFTKSSAPNKIVWQGRDDLYFIPIYFGYTSGQYLDVSTEFALKYQLSNRLIYDIEKISNGTSESSSSASSLENSNDQMADDMNDLATIESGYNQQFNNSLNDIDFTNPIQNNAGILPAANFVITAFNGLVNNPLSILIIIICILTIGKKVIGK